MFFKNSKTVSPLISSVSWGKISVKGQGKFKDVKLFPNGGREWDWRETGTKHRPGIQVADVEELIKNNCEVIVLTRGMQLVLQTCDETVEYLKSLSIETHIEETKAAVKLYNDFAKQGLYVGGLFHSTC